MAPAMAATTFAILTLLLKIISVYGICQYSALPSLQHGSAVSIAEGDDVITGTQVLYECDDHYRVAPGTPGSTHSVQSVTCQSDRTFTSLTYSCVYVYPESCHDHFTRDELEPALEPQSVLIDMDGPGSDFEPLSIKCQWSEVDGVCSSVSPSCGSTLNIPAYCTSTVLPSLFNDTTFWAPNTFGCNEEKVDYHLSPANLRAFLSNNMNCEQMITVTCTPGAGANTDGKFLGVRRNGETIGTAYDPIGATAILSGDVIGRLPVGACDCANSDSCGAERSCTCTSNSAAGVDTITVPLTASHPDYVVNYGIVGMADGTAGVVQANFAADDMGVAIGDIRCCTTV